MAPGKSRATKTTHTVKVLVRAVVEVPVSASGYLNAVEEVSVDLGDYLADGLQAVDGDAKVIGVDLEGGWDSLYHGD